MAKGRAARYDVWCRSCGCKMVIRGGKFGNFYGCTAYPACKNTMNIRDGALSSINDDPPNDQEEFYGSGGDYDPGGDFD